MRQFCFIENDNIITTYFLILITYAEKFVYLHFQ